MTRLRGGSAGEYSRSALARARTLVFFAIAGLLLTACRADSFSAPQTVDCGDRPGCRPTPDSPVNPVVHASIDDARLRLVPNIGDAAAQRALLDALNALNAALADGRDGDARVSLARVYSALVPLRITRADGSTIDTPDVAALRLELVPAANALGVRIQ